ncbi:uncharacterized protein TNIN_15771 [Trichonephila inaurata madagascariensis]|uniref:Uncharacterized protein n=1 Tax=Trichonephila inaurata madagascariensis TaxID=2747483 RepID=A0A8X6X666_9ARAC|nr:uncharacterized protein TNIN_227581 [Trichonephila inaurata madagascariensis]GFY73154.1 uncharacterized protein TNIN_15771 [Trichonephila inaurata madagascariensis]
MTSLPNTWTFRRVKHKETLTIICGGGLSRTGGPLLDILHMATRLRFRHCPGEESGEVNRFSFGRRVRPAKAEVKRESPGSYLIGRHRSPRRHVSYSQMAGDRRGKTEGS